MRIPILSRLLFTLAGIFLPLGAHKADYFSVTHIFNPTWPPHAKFHTGQTLAFSIVLGLLTIFFAWRPVNNKRDAVMFTTICAAMYWITQAAAILYPGTNFWDTPDAAMYLAGLPAQLMIDIIFLSVIAVAVGNAGRKSAHWQ